MPVTKRKRDKIKRKLFFKYRVAIIDENSLVEIASFYLNRLRIFVYGGIFALLMITITILVIIYTPLRQYILGFSETELRKQIVELTFKSDSLQQKIEGNQAYFASIQKVLNGDIEIQKVNTDSLKTDSYKSIHQLNLEPNEEEIKLRNEVAEEEKYSVFNPASAQKKQELFFPPISGSISNTFSSDQRHFGVDITAQQGTPIKAIADGTVIFAEWSAQNGFVVILEHANDFISVYKHNASVSKKQGDLVKSGEVIATVGSTGEYSSGSHLHFELWHNGFPVDPYNYMSFK